MVSESGGCWIYPTEYSVNNKTNQTTLDKYALSGTKQRSANRPSTPCTPGAFTPAKWTHKQKDKQNAVVRESEIKLSPTSEHERACRVNMTVSEV